MIYPSGSKRVLAADQGWSFESLSALLVDIGRNQHAYSETLALLVQRELPDGPARREFDAALSMFADAASLMAQIALRLDKAARR
jgi:hypothetical protein